MIRGYAGFTFEVLLVLQPHLIERRKKQVRTFSRKPPLAGPVVDCISLALTEFSMSGKRGWRRRHRRWNGTGREDELLVKASMDVVRIPHPAEDRSEQEVI